jgi:shikimate dehydrogenase
MALTGTTRLYAIVGDPVAHVRTPMVFNARFESSGVDAVCLPLHCRPDNLGGAFAGLRALENVDGFIVTAPYKQAAVSLCDEVTGEGKLVGAVNTIRREAGGRLVGDLFDGSGFIAGLRARGWDPAGRRVFMMGAGGAGNALAFALARARATAITIHNRTVSKAENLAQRLQAVYRQCDIRVGRRDPRGHDIVINATSVGLAPGDPAPFDISLLPASVLAAEVIMIPEVTPLLAAAKARGCPIHFGRHMLDCQVDLMFEFMRVPVQEGARARHEA